MDKNFIIAILLSTLIIIIFASPQYQKMFGKNVTTVPGAEQAISDSLKTRETMRSGEPVFPERSDVKTDSDVMSIPDMSKEKQTVGEIVQINRPPAAEDITLENDDMKVQISTKGGVITRVLLKKYNGKMPDEPVQILTEGESWYAGSITESDKNILFSDLIFAQKTVSENHAEITAELPGNKTITIDYSLDSNGYILKTHLDLSGNWNNPAAYFTWHGPINQTEKPFKMIRIWPFSMFMGDETNTFNKLVYLGQGERNITDSNGKEKVKRIYSNEGSQKIEVKKRGEEQDYFIGDLDWFAVRNKYFMTAAIPKEKMRWQAISRSSNTGLEKWFDFTLIKKISDGNTDIDIYMGPMSYDIIREYGRNLTEAMELSFRFIRPLSIGFLWMIKKLHSFIPNWGLVIILFSLIIKVILYPLSKTSYDSMSKMSKLQPQINELKSKYKNNTQMLHKATMELYKKEGVNPFSGCLPTLLQMPVFFALYPVVGRAFELRQAMFIPHWIEDLSLPDPYYILPVAMGISMFFQSRTTMKDPNQKPMLYIMPVMMVILFANFSSGLTLYWFLFNITSYLQQKLHHS